MTVSYRKAVRFMCRSVCRFLGMVGMLCMVLKHSATLV